MIKEKNISFFLIQTSPQPTDPVRAPEPTVSAPQPTAVNWKKMNEHVDILIIEIISPLLDRTASAYQFSKFLEEGFDLAINNTLQASAYQFSKFLEEGFDLIIDIISSLLHGTPLAVVKMLPAIQLMLVSIDHQHKLVISANISVFVSFVSFVEIVRHIKVPNSSSMRWTSLSGEILKLGKLWKQKSLSWISAKLCVRSENLNPTCSSQAETVNTNADKVRSENLNPTCSSQAETVNTNADKVHSENLNPICLSQAETANTNADKISKEKSKRVKGWVDNFDDLPNLKMILKYVKLLTCWLMKKNTLSAWRFGKKWELCFTWRVSLPQPQPSIGWYKK
ncbi:hypothetical protein DAPPUDRAFT_326929 [Daphnia pulex]|uniref:Uncharacterized protein n=1 Tax=Daphnia pulex TaxID=6669 RepID=E9H972_DAPPU|nr:hypothetical protein DAPPUDRAFT_326929 [Daphnia pulex]|eukprot:EFX71745.1 hypothetical protein DAPPUDRAFT_326929 [Daphnia pulex]